MDFVLFTEVFLLGWPLYPPGGDEFRRKVGLGDDLVTILGSQDIPMT